MSIPADLEIIHKTFRSEKGIPPCVLHQVLRLIEDCRKRGDHVQVSIEGDRLNILDIESNVFK